MSAAQQLLIVEDDADLRAELAEGLAFHDAWTVTEAGSGAEAWAALAANRFDAMVLDAGLPDIDGRDLVRELRAAGHAVPIIMLTGLNEDEDVIRGLDSGANDYLAKPVRLPVLLARLRAQMRIHARSEDAVLALGSWQFSPGQKLLTCTEGGPRLRLTEKETAILKYLHRAGSAIVSRDELLREVWGYNPAVTTHTLETHIYRLRQKIERREGEARLLLTEDGGYRLNL